ncbi:MAG TPA: crosslink repair DNA glycosylase YcaQ family protein [Gemmataceae bacterium]|nr:crosslink repair DNA glycosylase YcaQ family protein [Gemmataceae bacterium]
MGRTDFSIEEARRIALAAQGLDRPRPQGRVTAGRLSRIIRQLGLIQLDFVNVLVPSHYLVLFSRVGVYDTGHLDDLVYKRRQFTEQWAHEASIVPMEYWPLLSHRRAVHRFRPHGFERFMEMHHAYAGQVLNEVRERGPLGAEDLDCPDGLERRLALRHFVSAAEAKRHSSQSMKASSSPESWFGTVPRAVLEAHFGRGLLAVAGRRPGFARVYDLAERIVPREHHGQSIDREEAQRQLLLKAAQALGIGAAADLADYFRMKTKDARPRLAELVDGGELQVVQVESWREPAYLYPKARLPKRIAASALLSPFDPVVWYRARAAKLFDFDFRFEIFVPKEKRKWGTYVLPFLFGDRLVARVDLKADRTNGRLQVLASYREDHADQGLVASALAGELRLLARWLQFDSIDVEPRGDFARPLKQALRCR